MDFRTIPTAFNTFLSQTITSIRSKIISIPQEQKKTILFVSIGVGILLFIALNITLYKYGTAIGQHFFTKKTPLIAPSSTPYPFVKKGKIAFNINGGSKQGPQFVNGFIDPFETKIGEKQTFSLTITNEKPIKKAEILWKTDKKETTVPMKLVEGTHTNGRWEAVWNVDDTILYRLYIVATATDENQNGRYELSLR